MVNDKTFKISSDTHYPNYLSTTWSVGSHHGDSRIALFSKKWTVPIVKTFILSKLVITLMGFRTLRRTFHTQTASDYTWKKLNDVCHGWYIVPQ
jgi:hypothetical protein